MLSPKSSARAIVTIELDDLIDTVEQFSDDEILDYIDKIIRRSGSDELVEKLAELVKGKLESSES